MLQVAKQNNAATKLQALLRGASARIPQAEIDERFAKADADGSGGIDIAELKIMAAAEGQELNDEEAADVMGAIDTDGDGAIDVQEFQAWITQGAGAGAGAGVDPAQLLATAAAELGLGLFDGGEFLPGLLLPDHGIQCLAHITARPVVYPWHRCHNIV